jgi:UDP-N-acetylmuramyl pentapeptide synthase
MSKFNRINTLKKHVLSESVSRGLIADMKNNAVGAAAKKAHPDFFVVFLSVCNIKERAKVFHGTSKTLDGAWINAERAVEAFISKRAKEKKPYGVVWVKADVVTSRREINTVDFNQIVIGEQWRNFARVGVSLTPDFKGAKTAFLESELNGNKMIVYYSEREFNRKQFELDANLIFIDNLNAYRKINYKLPPIEEIPERITVFTTRGFFIDENNQIHELYADTEGAPDFGRRRIDEVDSKAVNEVIVGASEFLANEIQPDGKFIYGYFPAFDGVITGYNIIRHASTLWSIINLYRISGDDSLIPKIDSAIEFMEGEIEYQTPEIAYLVDRTPGEIKLGANGVAIIMLTEYLDVFGKVVEESRIAKYVDVVAKLANGILEFQNAETGKYWHVLHYPGFERKEEYRIVYYDGEATFALGRAYTFTKDKRFLDAATRAVDYFIANDYTRYIDHWVAYSMLEVTKYAPKPEYYEFALDNAAFNLQAVYDRATSFHTYLEMLTATWQTYQRALRDGIDSDYIKNYDPTAFAQTLYRRARHMLNGYFYPEYAMYMKSPEKILGAFMVRHHNYRTRIDDVQHFIGGYYFYSVFYDEIRAHLSDEFIRSLDKSLPVCEIEEGVIPPQPARFKAPETRPREVVNHVVKSPVRADLSVLKNPNTTNKCAFTSGEIADILGGSWYPQDSYFEADYFTIVPARVKHPKTCFIAMSYETWLKGTGNTGNYKNLFSDSHVSFAKKCEDEDIRNKVCGIISERPIEKLRGIIPQLIVPNSYEAMKTLSLFAREKMSDNATIIAVTGAVGKSTTVSMLNCMLHDESDYITNVDNYNTRTGVWVLSTAAARFNPAFAKEGDKPNVMTLEVAESALWMSSGGVCKTHIKPHIGVITHNGLTQYQTGSRNLHDISLVMAKVCCGIVPGGFAVMYRDMPEFELIKSKVTEYGAKPVSFGETSDCDSYVVNVECEIPSAGKDIAQLFTTVTAVILGEEITYNLGIIGKPGVINSLAALTTAKLAGFSVNQIAPKLAGFGGNQNTLQVSNVGDVCLIDDSHNSPVLSAIAAMELQSKIKLTKGKKRIVLLSRIVNMGDKTQELHLEMYKEPLTDSKTDKFFFHDPFDEMALLIPELPSEIVGGVFRTAEDVVAATLQYVRPGDTLLIKGGHRGTDFGKVLELITAGLNAEDFGSTRRSVKVMKPAPAKFDEAKQKFVLKDEWIKVDDSRGYGAITIAGDTYFGEWYNIFSTKKGRPHVLTTHGYGHSFEKIAPLLPEIDYNIINFEAVLTTSTNSPYSKGLTWTLHASPAETLEELKRRNIDAVMLANNHTMDFGEIAAIKSGEMFDAHGFKSIGFGKTVAEANRPLLLECVERQVILFNAYWFRKVRSEEYDWYATQTSPGAACLDKSVYEAISEYRKKYPKAFIVLSPHWGTDYDEPHEVQTRLAKKALAAGADCIIGHGAHIVSDMELIDGKFVLNSLGNFVFNSNGDAFVTKNRPKCGYLSKLLVSEESIKLRLYPFFAFNPECAFQPYPVTDEQFADLLARHPVSIDTSGKDEYGHYREIELT